MGMVRNAEIKGNEDGEDQRRDDPQQTYRAGPDEPVVNGIRRPPTHPSVGLQPNRSIHIVSCPLWDYGNGKQGTSLRCARQTED